MRTVDSLPVTLRINGRPVHPLLRPFALIFFLSAGGCDFLSVMGGFLGRTDTAQYAEIADWLLLAGLVTAGMSAMVALADYLGNARFRVHEARAFVFGTALVALLQGRNLDLRWSEGSVAVQSFSLVLTMAALFILLTLPTANWASLYRGADPARS